MRISYYEKAAKEKKAREKAKAKDERDVAKLMGDVMKKIKSEAFKSLLNELIVAETRPWKDTMPKETIDESFYKILDDVVGIKKPYGRAEVETINDHRRNISKYITEKVKRAVAVDCTVDAIIEFVSDKKNYKSLQEQEQQGRFGDITKLDLDCDSVVKILKIAKKNMLREFAAIQETIINYRIVDKIKGAKDSDLEKSLGFYKKYTDYEEDSDPNYDFRNEPYMAITADEVKYYQHLGQKAVKKIKLSYNNLMDKTSQVITDSAVHKANQFILKLSGRDINAGSGKTRG